MTQFTNLGLSKPLLDTLTIQGYETPTPIQAQAIPLILEGRDLLGCAQTGTGKTAAFALPLLDLLMTKSHRVKNGKQIRPRALILSPTRELASQIEESMRVYGHSTNLRHTVIFGGVSQFRQVRALQNGVDIIVATPGRLLDLIEQGYVDLGAIEFFVLDEADRMLDMGFIKPIRTVADMLPDKRQTLMFSATMPTNIKRLADSLLTNPASVAVETDAAATPLIAQSLFMVHDGEKAKLLRHILDDSSVQRAVVFTRTKHGANRLAEHLVGEGIKADAIHGNKSQSQRERALHAFRTGRARVLIATDVAARGLDVDGVTHVINYNLPDEPESYVHRIGRTGRAGAEGKAITLCSPEEVGLLRVVERIIGEPIDVHTAPESLGLKVANIPSRIEMPKRGGHRGRNNGPRKPRAKRNGSGPAPAGKHRGPNKARKSNASGSARRSHG